MEPVEVDETTDEAALALPVEVLRTAEALVFASAAPVSEAYLTDRLPRGTDVRMVMEALQRDYAPRGVNLLRIDDSWAFRTAADLSFHIRTDETEPKKLSRPALEVLAIIAYHQPVTRAEIEEIRGVGVSRGTIDQLLELDWIRLGRRRMTPGRPVTFVVTEAFLDHFGLESARDLPGLKELRAAGLLDNRPPPEGEDDGTDPAGDAGQDDMFDPGAEPDRGG